MNYMQPNDKPRPTQDDYEDPVLYMVVNDKNLPVPGLETAFVDYSIFDANTIEASSSTTTSRGATSGTAKIDTGTMHLVSQCICNLVTSSYSICVCNKMKSVCNCHGHVTPKKSSSSTNRVVTGCSCAPVH